jgi:phosphoribosylanthranilate isomerase
MMIKICGITRREDALAAVEAGASALGFIFYPKSPRCVTPSTAAQLGEGLATWKVGVFVDEAPATIESVMRAAKLDVAQIYGADIPENKRVWRAFRPGSFGTASSDSVSVSAAPASAPNPDRQGGDMLTPTDSSTSRHSQITTSDGVEAILLDGPTNGISFDWKVARDPSRKIIVAGGLDASNVAEAIRIAQPWGVDASSKLESAPGIKNHEKMRAFIKAAQEAK